jgi:hypothetical protein
MKSAIIWELVSSWRNKRLELHGGRNLEEESIQVRRVEIQDNYLKNDPTRVLYCGFAQNKIQWRHVRQH